jgi:PKD repeat protein
LDCAGNSFQHTSKVRAVLNYWGAIQDTVNIVAGDVPLLLMHGTDDPTVPFTYGQPFGLFTLPYVYGSNPIQKRVQNLGIYHEFYTSSMPGLHMLDGSNNGTFENPPTSFWYDTLLPRTTDFLVKMTKPNPVKISTDTLELCWGETATLLVDGSDNNYYRWTSYNQTTATEYTQQTTEMLTFTLPESGEFDIAVVEFNEVYCSSDTLWFHIIQRPEVVADFDFSIANYSDVTFTNQSINHTVQSWNFGDGTTSSESSPSHAYTQNGTYTVLLTVVDDFGCTSTISQTVTIAHLGLSDLEAKGINVYPNPIQNELNISNSGNTPVSVEVLDLNGKQLLNVQAIEAMSTKTIATNDWLNGMYFLRITDEQGGVNIVKIVK